MKNRRTLIAALGAGALTTPFSALAQQPPAPAGAPRKVWRIGYLGLGSHASSALYEAELAQGLRELGYVAGGNLVIDARYADGDLKRLPGLAAELVQLKADLIVAVGNDATLAAQAATGSIPIVMPTTSDPAGNGIIQSLARHGGNVTGIADLSAELGPKHLEMLLAMMASPASRPASGPTAGPTARPTAAKAPKVSRVAMLLRTTTTAQLRALKYVQDAGLSIGITIVPVYAATVEELDQAFASMRQQRATALIVSPNPFLFQQSGQISRLAAQHRLPVSAPYRVFADAGCLMSYGTDLFDTFRRSALFVDKIFKGRKPAELPVEQPVKYELVINGKTAKALGLKIPHALLILADKVIE